MNKESILKILRDIAYPPYSKDIVAFGMVKYVKADENSAEVRIFTGGDAELAKKITAKASSLLERAFPNKKIDVILLSEDPEKKAAPTPKKDTLAGVKIIVAVASGKGGVGKSTVAVNLARAFARMLSKNGEARVGLMDCDIHGPSATILFGEKIFPAVNAEQKIVPPQIEGIKVISMGMLVEDDQPLLWRGPMVTGAIKQFAEDLAWGELDAMVVDLPPGTGDAVLTAAQTIPFGGAIIVTTPNNLAAVTAARGAMIFEKLNVKILGVVENMAYLEMPDGSKEYIFGEGFADGAAARLNTGVIARLPLDKTMHTGRPSESSEEIFDSLAKQIADALK